MKNLFHSKTQIVYGVLAIVAILMIQTSRCAYNQNTADQKFYLLNDVVNNVEQNLAKVAVRDLEQQLAAISRFNVATLTNPETLACNSEKTLKNYKNYNPTQQNVAACLAALQAIDIDSSHYRELPPTVRQAFDALQTSCANLNSTFLAYRCNESTFNDILDSRDVASGLATIVNVLSVFSGGQTVEEWGKTQEGIDTLNAIVSSVTFVNYNNQISNIVPKAKAFQSCYDRLIRTIAMCR